MTVDLGRLHNGTPGLAAARVLAAGLGCEIEPVEGPAIARARGRVLLADRTTGDDVLRALSEALPGCAGVVVWLPGRTPEQAGELLAAHGFEHGSVDPVEVPESGALAVLAASAEQAERHGRLWAGRRPGFRALAIMPVYNEADVLERAVAALVSGGVDVYLIDHRSTDGSADTVERWLGRGLIGCERFPDDAGYDEALNGEAMVWREILRRVEDVAEQVPADWHLFVNADEFREAPWPDTTLADGLREVQELGFNAVNFELVNFMPTPGDAFVPGEDVRDHLLHYEPPGTFDLLQIKAWNSGGVRPDLRTHAGHSVLFDGRRVFPTPFILRHYPIRSAEHGMRKVHGERLPRFDRGERAGGWHVQYDDYAAGASEFVRAREDCERWEPAQFRARLLARAARQAQLLAAVTGPGGDLDPAAVIAWLGRRGLEGVVPQELDRAIEVLRMSEPSWDRRDRIGEIASALAIVLEARATLDADMVAAGHLRRLAA